MVLDMRVGNHDGRYQFAHADSPPNTLKDDFVYERYPRTIPILCPATSNRQPWMPPRDKRLYRGMVVRLTMARQTAQSGDMFQPNFAPAPTEVRIHRCKYVSQCRARSCLKRGTLVAEKVDTLAG